MSRTRNFIFNTMAMAVMFGVNIVSGFVIPKIMLVYYGSSINGLVSSLRQFLQYFTLVEAGLGAATVYALYKPLADRDTYAVNRILAATRIFFIRAGYIFVILTLFLALFYPIYIKPNELTSFDSFLLVLLLSTESYIDFFVVFKYSMLLQADQKMYIRSLSSTINLVGNILIVWTMASMGASIVFCRFVALLAIFSRMGMALYSRRHYRFLDFNVPPDTNSLDRRWEVLFQRVTDVVTMGAPILILTMVLRDLELVSVYAIFNVFSIGLISFLRIFDMGLFASFGDVIARRETKVLKKAYGEFEFFYYGLLTVIYAVAFVTVMSFIRIYTRGVNDANYDVPLIGFLFILNGLLSGIKIPQNMLVTAAGMFRETRWQTATQGIIVVAGGVLLAPRWGIEGVLTASILSNLYRCVDLVLFVPKHITGLPVRVTLFRLMRVALATLLIVAPFFWIPVEPQNFAQWFIVAGSITVYAVIVFFLFALLFDRQEMVCVMRRLGSSL